MSAEVLLARLDRVKPTGQGRWIARCPAHEDRSPSLSIRELEDGRLLVYDFGGCAVGDVLDALGLTITDLFAERITDHARPSRSRIPAGDLLLMLDEEATAVGILGAQFLEGRSIAETDWQRLAVAVRRIGVVAAHRSVDR